MRLRRLPTANRPLADRIEQSRTDEVLDEPVGRRLREVGVFTDVGNGGFALLADDLQDQCEALEMHYQIPFAIESRLARNDVSLYDNLRVVRKGDFLQWTQI